VFFMRNEDLTLHESWTYAGAVPTPAPVTDVFGDGDCTECSFASKLFGARMTQARWIIGTIYRSATGRR